MQQLNCKIKAPVRLSSLLILNGATVPFLRYGQRNFHPATKLSSRYPLHWTELSFA